MRFRAQRRVYLLFFLLRVGLVVSPGYIQPDEFFQGPEIAARDVLGAPSFVPWEWGGDPKTGKQLLPSEWGESIPCRSISFPAVACHLPLAAASRVSDYLFDADGWLLGGGTGAAANQSATASPQVVAAVTLLVPRLWMVVLSYIHDMAIMKICRAAQLPGWDVIAVMASSWTVFLLYGRTFSNVGETFWVTAAALTATSSSSSLSPVKKAAMFGAVTGAAIFTRFTYLAFAFPFGVVMLLLNLNDKGYTLSVASVLSVGAIVQCAWWTTVTAFTAIPVAAFFAQIDTLYYRSELRTTIDDAGGTLANFLYSSGVEDDSSGSNGISAILTNFPVNLNRWANANMHGGGLRAFLVDNTVRMWERSILTPVNLFEFNSNAANLEQFGLHPWWLHAVVNLQLLYGPIAIIAIAATCYSSGYSVYTPLQSDITKMQIKVAAKNKLKSIRGKKVKSKGNGVAGAAPVKKVTARAAVVRASLLASALCGVAALSAAPHQEPRFLLPAGVGLAALAAPVLWRQGNVIWWLWCTFNFAIGGFYAFVHQAGVIPSLSNHATTASHHHLVYYASYMPPRSMAGARGSTVYDFHKAETLAELGDMFAPLAASLRADWELLHRAGADKVGGGSVDTAVAVAPVLSVAMPGSVDAEEVSTMLLERHQIRLDTHTSNYVTDYTPHFSGEHPPQKLSDLSLRIYSAVFL